MEHCVVSEDEELNQKETSGRQKRRKSTTRNVSKQLLLVVSVNCM